MQEEEHKSCDIWPLDAVFPGHRRHAHSLVAVEQAQVPLLGIHDRPLLIEVVEGDAVFGVVGPAPSPADQERSQQQQEAQKGHEQE